MLCSCSHLICQPISATVLHSIDMKPLPYTTTVRRGCVLWRCTPSSPIHCEDLTGRRQSGLWRVFTVCHQLCPLLPLLCKTWLLLPSNLDKTYRFCPPWKTQDFSLLVLAVMLNCWTELKGGPLGNVLSLPVHTESWDTMDNNGSREKSWSLKLGHPRHAGLQM